MVKRKEADFGKVGEELNAKDRDELNNITRELRARQKDTTSPAKDQALKKRIAKICLKLVEDTPKDKIAIMETSYIITGNFVWSNYGDELDAAIDIARNLELPEHHVCGDVFELWEKMRMILKKYLEN